MTHPILSPSRRRGRKLLLWAGVFVMVAAGALITLLLTLDANAYRPALERELSRALGRRVSIGDLSHALSLRPTFSARDLRVANPDWASRPDLVSAKHARIQVDLIALWHDRLALRRIALAGVDLLLERSSAGTGNWVFAPDRATHKADQAVSLPDIDAVALEDVRIGWRRPDGRVREVKMARASAVLRGERPFQLHVEASLDGFPMRAAVRSKSSLQAALRGSAWNASLELEAPQARALVEANFPRPFELESAELAVQIRGERLSALSPLAGAALPAWGPYRMSARLRYANGTIALDRLALVLEGLPARPSRLEVAAGQALLSETADTQLKLAGKLGDAHFTLDATSASLPQLLHPSRPLPVVARAALGRLTLEANGSLGLYADAPRFDLVLKAKGDALAPLPVFAARPVRGTLPVDLSARIAGEGRRYRASRLEGSIAGCRIAGDLALDATARPRLTGALRLGRLDLAPFDMIGAGASREPSADKSPPDWLNAMDAQLSVKLAQIVGLGVAAENLAGRVELAHGRVRLDALTGSLARTAFAASATIAWTGEGPRVRAQLAIPVLDVRALRADRRPPKAAGDWHDAPLPISALPAVDGSVQIAIDRVAGLPVSLGGLQALARLQRGKLVLAPVSAKLASVSVQGQAALETGSPASLAVTLQAARADLAPLLRELRQDAPISGRVGTAEVTLQTLGSTPRALLANARVVAHVEQATLRLEAHSTPIALQHATARAGPREAVQISAVGTVDAAPVEFDAAGGPLVELLDMPRAWPQMRARLRGTTHGQRFEVTAETGPLQRLLRGRDVPIEIQAALDGARAKLTGTVSDLRRTAGSPLRAEVAIDSLARLPRWLPDLPLPDLPATASASVMLRPGTVSLQHLAAQAGKSDLSGSLRVKWQDRREIAADLRSQLIDATPWQRRNTGSGQSDLDQPLPVRTLRSLDATVRLRAQRYVEPRVDLTGLTLSAALTEGLLELSADVAEGDSQAKLRFDVRGDVPAAALTLSIQGVPLEALKQEGVAPTSAVDSPRLSIRAAIAGTGGTPMAFIAASQGEVLVTAGAGMIRPVAAPYLAEDILFGLLNVLVPGRKPPDYSSLECAAARLDIAGGVASSPDGIAIRFKHMDILGSGAMNLRTREILFGFRAVRRQWLSFSPLALASDFARISGTLDKPQVGLDREGLLIKGGAAWATAGLSLLATDLLRKLRASEDPCASIVATGRIGPGPLDALIRKLPLPGLPAGSR